MPEKQATFVVAEADEEATVLRDAADGQVHTLRDGDHGFESGEVVEATLAPDPPLEVTWSVREVTDRRAVPVERVDEPPARSALDAVAGSDPGDLVRLDPDDGVAAHAIAVPDGETATAAEAVLADPATRSRAARLGADAVEVRAADGVVSVRYR